jgi:arylsulfatase A-like enzyme
VIALETVAVCVARRSELAGGYELFFALDTVLPICALLALPIAALGAVICAAIEHADTRQGRYALALVAAAGVGVASWANSGGRMLQGARRPAFVAIVVIAAAAAVWFLAPQLKRLASWLADKHGLLVPMAVALAVIALEIVNVRVLPKLYPAFHLALAALSVALAPLASLAARRLDGSMARAWQRIAVGVASLGLVLAGAYAMRAPQRLRLRDNLRWIFLEHAPIASHGVRVAAWLEPPPPLDDEVDAPAAGALPAERSIDWGGRDVLLVTIDALRADHVGAYGYERKTTPRIDALAAEGAMFEAAYTPTPHTSYAVSSLMTGKYMRPLVLQGLGADSETLAQALRRYDYRTAAFYPPAVFFIDRERFAAFQESALGFEYKKEQFSRASERAEELAEYLASQPHDKRLFVWVHLFEPHEPYESQAPFGERAVDRYDSEIAAADAGLGACVDAMRKARPGAVVIVSADHGEEFGDHGGKYHGTSVYDEQVRVPLVIHAPGVVAPRRIAAPVGLVDLLPTILVAKGIPVSPRVRGRDLGGLLTGKVDREGFAFSETEEQTLLAKGTLRLICARRVGACRLFDVARDRAQARDAAGDHPRELEQMKRELRRFGASLGRFESGDGAPWPHALRRAIAGDVEAAVDVAGMLADADVTIRRKAAETLFELAIAMVPADKGAAASEARERSFGDDVAAPLARALSKDEDEIVKRWCALALTRLGQGVGLAFDLVQSPEPSWRRLAALALASSGDARGEQALIDWWSAAYGEDDKVRETMPFERGKQVALALARIRSKSSVIPLTRGLADVRLRSAVAAALATIGDAVARPALAQALAVERYQDARVAIARASVALGGGPELAAPLAHYLGVPDPMLEGLALATEARILGWIGGPNEQELARLREFAKSGVLFGAVIPEGGNGQGYRVVIRARSRDGLAGEVRVSPLAEIRAVEDRTRKVPSKTPQLDPARTVKLAVTSRETYALYDSLPSGLRLRAKESADFVVYATQNVELESIAVVPLVDEGPVISKPR